MLNVYRAYYLRVSDVLDGTTIETIVYVRTMSKQDAERLSAQVFEQIYGSTPAKLKFAFDRVEWVASW